MPIKDSYKTIAQESLGEFKDRGSKFIAYATPLSLEADFSIFLEKIKKEHPKARHFCYAWRLGLDGNQFRANDDGEPSGTAGRPILGQIDSFDITNVGVVVVRYFGGTLLGTSGLIHAYRESACEALKNAEIIEKIVEDIVEIQFGYDKMADVMNAIKRLNINVLKQDFNDFGMMVLSIRKSETEATLLNFRALVMKIPIEQAQLLKNTEGVVITLVG
jgi:uncharacterized YigZ family protein